MFWNVRRSGWFHISLVSFLFCWVSHYLGFFIDGLTWILLIQLTSIVPHWLIGRFDGFSALFCSFKTVILFLPNLHTLFFMLRILRNAFAWIYCFFCLNIDWFVFCVYKILCYVSWTCKFILFNCIFSSLIIVIVDFIELILTLVSKFKVNFDFLAW